jgi:hypothetical protein
MGKMIIFSISKLIYEELQQNPYAFSSACLHFFLGTNREANDHQFHYG